MTAILAFAEALWLLRTIRADATHVALWQQKEYRLDRMRAHLALLSVRASAFPLLLIKIAAFGQLVLDPTRALPVGALLVFTYVVEAGLFLIEAVRRAVHRPQLTVKAIALLFLTLVFVIVFAGVTARQTASVVRAALLADLLLPVIAAVLVGAFHPFTAVAKRRIVARAATRRREYPELTVVGITGSYGKSSTKEALAVLLGGGDDIVKTPGNVNTEIGVAQFFLSRVTPDHRTLICEMGAYRTGEIAHIAEIVRPRVGILTAVAPQHLALFGSVEAIREAKYELIRALPTDGIALFHVDDPVCAALAARTTHCCVVRYGRASNADVRVENVRADARAVRWTLRTPAESVRFDVPLLGEQHAVSVTAAAAAAWALGTPLAAIAARASSLRPPARTMEPRSLRDGTLVVDDSYSANPDGVLAALRALRLFDRPRKIVLLPALIELGREARGAHERIGRALADVATHVFLTQRDFAEEVTRGLRSVPAGAAVQLTIEPRTERLLHALTPLLGSECVLLLEGRVPTKLRERILENSAR
jgi:UDP-N-acetylmuramoyl-tripeptide--D-alanyl-D-alanine ligase